MCGGDYAYRVIVDLSARELRLSISIRGILKDKEPIDANTHQTRWRNAHDRR
jgi:hypothetical protein